MESTNILFEDRYLQIGIFRVTENGRSRAYAWMELVFGVEGQITIMGQVKSTKATPSKNETFPKKKMEMHIKPK